MGQHAGIRARLALVALLLLPACGTAVHDEAAKGNLDAVQAMVQANPALVHERAYKDRTPLYFAIARGHAEVIAYLLEHGAEVNAQDVTGLTPLHVAVWWNRLDVARLLLEYGADVHARDAFGDTPLHTAAMLNRPDAVDLLVASGADPAARNDAGLTPLDLAVEHRADAAAERLRGLGTVD